MCLSHYLFDFILIDSLGIYVLPINVQCVSEKCVASVMMPLISHSGSMSWRLFLET